MLYRLVKTYTTYGLRSAIRNVLGELKTLRKHRQGMRKAHAFRGRFHLRLHIGCGPKLKSEWINIDLSSKADIMLDLREPLPFSESSCSVIYSEHFLEHLEYPLHAIAFLRECYRLLEPGGVLSLGVPDTEWPIAEYAGTRRDDYFRIAKERWHAKWCQTQMEQLNYHFRQDGDHRFAYDLLTLAQALTSVGFQQVERREFDPDLDSADRELGTLYVRAFKPAEEKQARNR